MGKNSAIAWTDHTFNPWIGCMKVSEGCKFCYAEHDTFARRERSNGRELWGPKVARHHTSEEYWHQPLKWSYEVWFECQGCGWRGPTKLLETGANCPDCGSMELLVARQRVFCMSLGDILEDRDDLVPWRNEVFDLIEQTPTLDWLLLTKRIELASSLLPYVWFNGEWPFNVWIGTSVENQKTADERLSELMKLPAPQRFISVEPMLERIELDPLEASWVIVGGESGSKCRPFEWAWARDIKHQCQEAGIAFFMKQGGGYPDKRDQLADFPEDLRIREWPK